MQDAPHFKKGEEVLDLFIGYQSDQKIYNLITAYGGQIGPSPEAGVRRVTIAQARWLAEAGPQYLAYATKPVYRELIRLGHADLIPKDHVEGVLREV